ncbi:MAG: hypothetical protein WCV63_00690 [Negativicutes bacterium]|jgi:hypothetical protein
MKKTALILVIIVIAVMSSVHASSIAVPENFTFPRITIQGAWLPGAGYSVGSASNLSGGSSNFMLGGTLGFGGGFAGQYRGTTLNVPAQKIGNFNQKVDGMLNEFNVLYKIDKYVAVYAGATYTFGKLVNNDTKNEEKSNSFGVQIGGMLDVPIYRELSGFADYSIGSQIAQFAIGLEYRVISAATVNVAYYNIQQYSLNYSGGITGYTMQGAAIGFSVDI